MSTITYNPNDNQIPLQQQQQPTPQALQGAGVYWGNQPNYGSNQPNYWGNQTTYQPNYWGNQSTYQPNYWGNQTTYQPNYWHNQPHNYWRNQQPNYWHHQPYNYWGNQPPNYWNTQFYHQNRSRSHYYNFRRRYFNNNNYRPQQRQQYVNMNNNYNSGRYNNNGSNQPPPPSRNRTYGPKRPTFGDFISPRLQNQSILLNTPNRTVDLDLSTTETTSANVLPQRQQFVVTTMNTKQPFVVNQQKNHQQGRQQNQCQTTTTAAFLRQPQQLNLQNQFNSNPFAVIAEEEEKEEEEEENNNDDDVIDEPLPITTNKQQQGICDPRQFTSNDFMSLQLHDISLNVQQLLPEVNHFNTGSISPNMRPTTPVNTLPQLPEFSTTAVTPVNVLPQQSNFPTTVTTNNTKLSFQVSNQDDSNQRQQQQNNSQIQQTTSLYTSTPNISLYDNTVFLFYEPSDDRDDSNQLQQQQNNSQNQQTTTSCIWTQVISSCNRTTNNNDEETTENKQKMEVENSNKNDRQDICVEQKQNKKQKLSFHEKNKETIKLLPIFKSFEPYEICFVNRNSSFIFLSQLNEQIKQTKQITLLTRYDEYARKYALLVVIFEQQGKLTIVTIEMFHLPYCATASYSQIKELFHCIFASIKTILVWEEIYIALTTFSIYNLLWPGYIKSNPVVNLEKKFRAWYNPKILFRNACSISKPHICDLSCMCSSEPYKYLKANWPLSMAIACTFDEYLPEQMSTTVMPWGMGLDSSLDMGFEETSKYYFSQPIASLNKEECRSNMINMIVNQCLAIKKLAMVVDNNWNQEQLELYNEQRHKDHQNN